MEIINLVCGVIQTNVTLFFNEKTREAIVIDAPDNSYSEIMNQINKRKGQLKALLITHGHWDHINDAGEFQETGAVLYGHPDLAAYLKDPEGMSGMPFSTGAHPSRLDHPLRDGETLSLIGLDFTVLHVPGHHPASIAFYLKGPDGDGACFTGDLIFRESVGRTDLEGGAFAILEKSIREKIYTLPDDTVLYPGHGETTTVGHEKQYNPFINEEESHAY